MQNTTIRRAALVLAGAALGSTLTGCGGFPEAVGTVVGKDLVPAHIKPASCSGGGATPLMCSPETPVPATYSIRVQRDDGRVVGLRVDRRRYRHLAVGDHFDQNDLGHVPLTWESHL